MEDVFRALFLTYTNLSYDPISLIQKFLTPKRITQGTLLFEKQNKIAGNFWKVLKRTKKHGYILVEVYSKYTISREKHDIYCLTKKNLYPQVSDHIIEVDAFFIERDFIVISPGHMCVCEKCSEQILQTCPMCRLKFQPAGIRRVFSV